MDTLYVTLFKSWELFYNVWSKIVAIYRFLFLAEQLSI